MAELKPIDGHRLIRVIKNPYKILVSVVRSNPIFYKHVSDKTYLGWLYRAAFGKKLDWENPKTFNGKLQWLKLYDKQPEYTTMVDKYDVKKYVASIIGERYIIPTLGVWDSFDKINFNALPNQFVLKCTHDSGGLVICRDKSKLNIPAEKKKFDKNLKTDFFYGGREWPYKNVPHRIIAEQYMEDNLRDYDPFCMDRVPRMTLVYSECLTKDGLKEVFFDEVWFSLNMKKTVHDKAIFPTLYPDQYQLMKHLAARLSEYMSFARIDFYKIDEKTYFGEITFWPARTFDDFKPEEWDLGLGGWSKSSDGKGYRLTSDICSILLSNSCNNSKFKRCIYDYKVFCFNGEIDSIMACTGREKGHPDFYFYDVNWNRLYYQHSYLEKGGSIKKPRNLDEMVRIAKTLSKGFRHVRVDLFDVDDNLYFGELTLYNSCGFDTDISYETDLKWGEKIFLPNHKKDYFL